MSHFMERLNTPVGHLTFYFNRIYTAEGTRYHMSVNCQGKMISFNMQLNGANWELVKTENCPPWLSEMQMPLSETIFKYVGS
ncbi:MAG: hypothetical protein ACXWCZ_03745 [Flavisolibacter sp.]